MNRFCDNPMCYFFKHDYEKQDKTEVLIDSMILEVSSHEVNGVNLCACCYNALVITDKLNT